MIVPTLPADPRFYPVLRRYSQGQLSAYDAACEIQALGIPGYHDPSASEVILWARQSGYGIPAPTRAEAAAEVARILDRAPGPRDKPERDDSSGP